MRLLFRNLLLLFVVLMLQSNAATCFAQTKNELSKTNVENVILLKNKALQFEKAGNKEQALQYYNLALEEAKRYHLQAQQATCLKDIAMLLKNEDSQTSLMHLNNALNIAHNIKHSKLEADIYHAIAEVYKLQQNYKAALVALESHYALIDSLIAKERKQDTTSLKEQNRHNMERGIGLTLTISLLVIFCLFYFYFRKIRALNQKLRNTIITKDKLFSILGHDLRGPAGSMMQALNLFGRNIFTEEEEKTMIESLKKQSKSLYEAIETLFQWANSQLNGVQIYLQQFDAVPIIYKNIDLLAGQAGLKQITISPEISGSTFINADPNHFDYIIRNLLSNAIKFSNKGGKITVSIAVKDDVATFYVIDDGIGMTPLIQQQFNTNNMTSTFGTAGEKGIGLGLSLTREFIKANHGKLSLESKPQSGTSVSFSMPMQ